MLLGLGSLVVLPTVLRPVLRLRAAARGRGAASVCRAVGAAGAAGILLVLLPEHEGLLSERSVLQ